MLCVSVKKLSIKVLIIVNCIVKQMATNHENLLDAEDYRQRILEIILSEKHVSRPVFELRFVLFIRAANYYYSHDQSQCLKPFPSCFFDPATNTLLYDDLRTHLLNIPQLDTIQVKIFLDFSYKFVLKVLLYTGINLIT